jgi:hypothetical protein
MNSKAQFQSLNNHAPLAGVTEKGIVQAIYSMYCAIYSMFCRRYCSHKDCTADISATHPLCAPIEWAPRL